MIMGFDPSTKGTGWGILDNEGKLIKYGALRPPKTCKTVQAKLYYIYINIVGLLEKYNPDYVVSEDQYGGKSIKTLKTLSQLRGVIMLACEEKGLDIEYYWPTTIKSVAGGSGKAKKQDMINAICQRYDIEGIDDDTADAIGVAYTHFMKKGIG